MAPDFLNPASNSQRSEESVDYNSSFPHIESEPHDISYQQNVTQYFSDEELMNRYGKDSPLTKKVLLSARKPRILCGIIGVVILTIIVGILYYFITENHRSPITATVQTYKELMHEPGLEVLVRVERIDPHKPASCVIRAVDAHNNEVGRREFLVLPSNDADKDISLEITTLKPADHASVYACTLTIPHYLIEEPTAQP